MPTFSVQIDDHYQKTTCILDDTYESEHLAMKAATAFIAMRTYISNCYKCKHVKKGVSCAGICAENHCTEICMICRAAKEKKLYEPEPCKFFERK
jgi:hypothetical protein